MFNYIFCLGPPGKHLFYTKPKKTCYMSAGFAGRHVVGFGDLSIDVVLEVQKKRYSQILYLIKNIAYGLHLWYKIKNLNEIRHKTISLHPGLATSLHMPTCRGC